MIGIGGIFKNLGKIYNKDFNRQCTSSKVIALNNSSELKILCQSLRVLNLKVRESLCGLSKKRADIILDGCEIITHLTNYCNLSNVVICNEYLRTGILNSYLNSKYDILETITNSLKISWTDQTI